ncbi:hypothetical protein AGLY_015801 [Aphis glycines]|uniref:HAT C-terminal dimerisation domain-containing protein n=1 Tax=Aphis glycines TaxID=307491 RepID=A0A6G0T1E3_APHGL|nr:hypothetical protein AGLY_015801 [Aphis glycines]
MLSKNTVNKVILAILELIRRKIKAELGDKQFSVQVDSTQDIGSTDQAAVCLLRYVFNFEVNKRLFAILEVTNSSGEGMYLLLKKCFDDHSINFKNIVAESFDGAVNMQGEFNGLHAYIRKENENSIYIWCYAHVLNLCICDTCDNRDAIKLFGLLNRLSTFFSTLTVWVGKQKEQQELLGTGQNKLRKLQKIGETRWWSREKALKWVFSGDDCLYPVVLSALNFVTTSSKFDPKSSSEALYLIENLCNFNIICTAHVFLKIFVTVGSTSTYLQTKNLDLSAWIMVETTIKEIDKINFDDVMSVSENFCSDMNTKLSTIKLPENIIIESEFKQDRIRRTYRMFDEICSDETPINPKENFKVEVFMCIINQLKTSLSEKFTNNTSLIVDIQYLLPKHYKDLKSDNLPESALKKLSTLSSVDHSLLTAELKHFASIYNKVTQPLNKSIRIVHDTNDDNSHEEDYGSNDNLYKITQISGQDVKSVYKKNDGGHNRDSYLLCVHKLIYSLNMHSALYNNLFTAIEFVLTLSVSQGNCERVFSKLKLIKNRLRSSLGNEHLEAFLLMTVEKEIVDEIEFEDILEIIRINNMFIAVNV